VALKIRKLQRSHYKNVSTDPLGTGGGSLATGGAHFGSRCVMTQLFHTSQSRFPIGRSLQTVLKLAVFWRSYGCSWELLSPRIRYSVAQKSGYRRFETSGTMHPATQHHTPQDHTPYRFLPITSALQVQPILDTIRQNAYSSTTPALDPNCNSAG